MSATATETSVTQQAPAGIQLAGSFNPFGAAAAPGPSASPAAAAVPDTGSFNPVGAAAVGAPAVAAVLGTGSFNPFGAATVAAPAGAAVPDTGSFNPFGAATATAPAGEAAATAAAATQPAVSQPAPTQLPGTGSFSPFGAAAGAPQHAAALAGAGSAADAVLYWQGEAAGFMGMSFGGALDTAVDVDMEDDYAALWSPAMHALDAVASAMPPAPGAAEPAAPINLYQIGTDVLLSSWSSELGSGGYGTVKVGFRDGRPVAVKMLKSASNDLSTARDQGVDGLKRILLQEVTSQAMAHQQAAGSWPDGHPNIIKFLGMSYHPPAIIMEVAECSLWDRVETEQRVQHQQRDQQQQDQQQQQHWHEKVDWLRQAAAGMAFLHDECQLLHNDLRAANMLLFRKPEGNSRWQVKICDFGLAAKAEDGHTARVSGHTNAQWVAPEVLRQQPVGDGGYIVTRATDVYSFGCMMVEALTGKTPHHIDGVHCDLRTFQVTAAWSAGNGPHIDFPNQDSRLPCLPDPEPPKLRQLLRQCCHPTQPTERPGTEQLHNLLQEIHGQLAAAGAAAAPA